MKKHLYQSEKELIAILVNTFGNYEHYATCYNISGDLYTTGELIRVIDIAAGLSRCLQFKEELQEIKAKFLP